ncbi:hypothetical protein BDN70DRAFT_198666 [Pholiota conissans]|uniref:Uncharacterized protein n=1 Tax=Pholiota conissans TaxID=109636 RepID=A0A9P5YY69_9AGAR|nr:hypothetical protein BDN70DRAFT_198666 [Pholiota conissans]
MPSASLSSHAASFLAFAWRWAWYRRFGFAQLHKHPVGALSDSSQRTRRCGYDCCSPAEWRGEWSAVDGYACAVPYVVCGWCGKVGCGEFA